MAPSQKVAPGFIFIILARRATAVRCEDSSWNPITLLFLSLLSSHSAWIDNTTTHSRATRPALVVAMAMAAEATSARRVRLCPLALRYEYPIHSSRSRSSQKTLRSAAASCHKWHTTFAEKQCHPNSSRSLNPRILIRLSIEAASLVKLCSLYVSENCFKRSSITAMCKVL